MSAEIKTPSVEFIEVGGLEARSIDAQQLEWPADSRVVFAVENGSVVGRSSMYTLPVAVILDWATIEGTEIDKAKRGGTLAVRLIKFVEQVFRDHGKTHAFAFSYDDQPEVGGYLERFGYTKVPFTVWQKQLVKE